MGQYKLSIWTRLQFGIHFSISKWDISFKILCFEILYGRTNGAKGFYIYNPFKKDEEK